MLGWFGVVLPVVLLGLLGSLFLTWEAGGSRNAFELLATISRSGLAGSGALVLLVGLVSLTSIGFPLVAFELWCLVSSRPGRHRVVRMALVYLVTLPLGLGGAVIWFSPLDSPAAPVASVTGLLVLVSAHLFHQRERVL